MGLNMVEVVDPNMSYALTRKAALESKGKNASWVQQDLPANFRIYLSLIKQRFPVGFHHDIGTDNGEKAIKMLVAGLDPMVAFDIDPLNIALPQAKLLASEAGVSDKITFLKADASVEIPVLDNSVTSATSICVAGTHFTNEERVNFSDMLFDKMVPSGLLLSVDFSASDVEFYGEPICNSDGSPRSREYHYLPNLDHPHAKPNYKGMFNQHHTEDEMRELYGQRFKLLSLIHIIHPNSIKDSAHATRYLWQSIYQRVQ